MFTIVKERYPFTKKSKKVMMAKYRNLIISAHAMAMFEARIIDEKTSWIPYPVKNRYERALTSEKMMEIANIIEADLKLASRKVATKNDCFLVPAKEATYVVRLYNDCFYVVTTYAHSMCANKLK